MSSRRSVTRASAPLQGRAARASSRDVKKVVPKPGSAASKRRQEVALPLRKATGGGGKINTNNKRKRGDGSASDDDDGDMEEPQEKAARESVSSATAAGRKSVIDAKEDEVLMRAVVAQEKKLTAPKTKKMPVWDVIAKACGSRFTTGHTAFGKVKWLQRVVRDKRHPQYGFLTPALIKLLKQYLQFMEAPCKDEGADDEDEDEHVTFKEVVENEDDESAEDVEEKEESKRKSPKMRRVTEANVAEEEEMMAIVLKHASRFATADDKARVWDSIARESHGRFDSGVAARHHYAQLMEWLNPSHYKHSVLTPILRVQLKELQDSGYNRSGKEGDEATGRPTAAAKAKAAVPGTSSSIALKNRKTEMLRRILDEDNDNDDTDSSTPQSKPVTVAVKATGKEERVPPTRLPNTYEDDCLLYEILRVRPFDHKGESNPYWEKILAALHQRLGSTDVFPDRTVCQKRMSKLLNAVRRPDHPSTPSVTPLQLEVLTVLLSILDLKYQWAGMMKEKTPFYVKVVDQINTLQEKIKPKAPGLNTKPTLVPAGRPALGDLPELPAEPEAPMVVAAVRQYHEEYEETKDSEPPRPTVSRELQAKVHSLSLQASQLERERHDHAKAFQTMIQVLQDEREKLQRESESVLRKVEKQRADRKEEFKTMINLVAHAAAQYRA